MMGQHQDRYSAPDISFNTSPALVFNRGERNMLVNVNPGVTSGAVTLLNSPNGRRNTGPSGGGDVK